MGRKLKFGLVGMGFGANFAPILKHHPNTELYALCRRNPAELEKAGMDLGVANLYTDFGEMLSLTELDAILIMSPVSEHYTMAKASLEAGSKMVRKSQFRNQLCSYSRKIKKELGCWSIALYILQPHRVNDKEQHFALQVVTIGMMVYIKTLL